MPKVTIISLAGEKREIEVKPLTKLWDIEGLSRADFVEEPNCGGEGRCKKCKVKVNGEEKLSCLEKVYKEDLELELCR